jgi:hypothetical protein
MDLSPTLTFLSRTARFAAIANLNCPSLDSNPTEAAAAVKWSRDDTSVIVMQTSCAVTPVLSDAEPKDRRQKIRPNGLKTPNPLNPQRMGAW